MKNKKITDFGAHKFIGYKERMVISIMVKKTGKKVKIALLVLAVLLIGLTGSFYSYVSDYSHAKEAAIAVMAGNDVRVTSFDDGVAFGNLNSENGFIFYPGGKVEYTAYAPLLLEVAKGGVMCVIAEMPYNLAVFDSNAAVDIISIFPKVKHWYIGGHSLGGAMAADYAAKNPEQFKGLILLAAYSASDISNSRLKVLSIYGSEDQVLNMDRYKEGLNFLPPDYQEELIQGGNHAGFGDYGLQKGDGIANITAQEQWDIASKNILTFIRSNK